MAPTPAPTPPAPPAPMPTGRVQFERNGRCLHYGSSDPTAAPVVGTEVQLGGCYIRGNDTSSLWMIAADSNLLHTASGGLCVQAENGTCALHTHLVLGRCDASNELTWDQGNCQLRFGGSCKAFCAGDQDRLSLEQCSNQVTRNWDARNTTSHTPVKSRS
jgi:hypothetical protein